MYKPFLCEFYELMIVPHNVKERKNSGTDFPSNLNRPLIECHVSPPLLLDKVSIQEP